MCVNMHKQPDGSKPLKICILFEMAYADIIFAKHNDFSLIQSKKKKISAYFLIGER